MKKLSVLVFALICAFGLIGCNAKSTNHIISNEPSIIGTIQAVNEHSVLIENETGEYSVSLNAENKDGIYSPMMVGDLVAVYYDGNIAETYPMQINTVYAIVLQESADPG